MGTIDTFQCQFSPAPSLVIRDIDTQFRLQIQSDLCCRIGRLHPEFFLNSRRNKLVGNLLMRGTHQAEAIVRFAEVFDRETMGIFDIRCMKMPVTILVLAFDGIASSVGLNGTKFEIGLDRVLLAGHFELGYVVKHGSNTKWRRMGIHRTSRRRWINVDKEYYYETGLLTLMRT